MVRPIFLTVVFLITTASYAKEKYPDFTRQIFISGVGQAKLEYAYSGEPISRPKYLALYIKCKKSDPWRELGRYLMCELKDYEYDAKSKKLRLQYTDGRVNQQTGESFCDQLGESEFDFANVCKTDK